MKAGDYEVYTSACTPELDLYLRDKIVATFDIKDARELATALAHFAEHGTLPEGNDDTC